jgi:hypothetical protein
MQPDESKKPRRRRKRVKKDRPEPAQAPAPATLVISVSRRDLWRATAILAALIVLAAVAAIWSASSASDEKHRAMQAATGQVHQETARLLAKAGTILQWSDGELNGVDAAVQAQRRASNSAAIDPEPLQVRLGTLGAELDQARQSLEQTRQLGTNFAMQAALAGWTGAQDPVSAGQLSELGARLDRITAKYQNVRMAVDQLNTWRGMLAQQEAANAAAAARRAASLAAQRRQPQVIQQVVYRDTPSVTLGFGYSYGWGYPGYYNNCYYPRYAYNNCYRPGFHPGYHGGSHFASNTPHHR